MENLTKNLNFQELKLKADESEFSKDNWDELILDNEGFFEQNYVLVFDFNGVEAYVNFKLYVSGDVTRDDGDYWTPPNTDVDINHVEVEVEEFYVDDVNIELTGEMTESLTNEIKKVIN